MGFDANAIKLLLHSKKQGLELKKVVTIGRQNIHVKDNDLIKTLNGSFSSNEMSELMTNDHTYAEGFLKILGAEACDSIDVSNYEKATIIHDMNFPIPERLKGKYNTVIDAGSLEHVFNFPVAIKNCMEMLAVGGIYIGLTPANNFFGHGFYQFSPELYFRVFSVDNGFEVKKLILYIDDRDSDWYEINDPKDVSDRITLINSYPLYLYVMAKKTISIDPFTSPPQQSDYNNLVWKGSTTVYRPAYQTKGILQVIKNIIPISIKDYGLRVINRIKILSKQVGNLKPFAYKKVSKDNQQ